MLHERGYYMQTTGMGTIARVDTFQTERGPPGPHGARSAPERDAAVAEFGERRIA
jgi:hypothetical protein